MDRRQFLGTALAAASAQPSFAQEHGRYVGVLRLESMSGGRLMRLTEPFSYVDLAGQQWHVPRRGVVDGASIPRVFWSVIGGPWDGPYREASVIHDWYCAVRVMPWKQTHRMFYDAMRTSNVPEAQARLMFLAVRYAGPTWDDLTLQNSRLLTLDGKRRLDPPGRRRGTSSFASEAEAAQAKDALVEKLNALASQAQQQQLDVTGMEQLVDASGRAEMTAAMLEP